jgi:acetolactate synthase-1/2/3 large subunit
MPLFTSDRSPIHPYRLAWEINEFLGEDTIYIGDGGDVVTISAQAVRPRQPGQWMDPGALGSLGRHRLCACSQARNPKKEVMCLFGDGSFGMTAFDGDSQPLQRAVPRGVGNNSAMNQIRYGRSLGMVRSAATSATSSAMSSSKFAHMLNGHGEEVREAAKIGPALKRAREAIAKTGAAPWSMSGSTPMNTCLGTKNQTMYK